MPRLPPANEQDKSFHEIIDRLDILSQQLYSLALGQRSLESGLRKLQQDLPERHRTGSSLRRECFEQKDSIHSGERRPAKSSTVTWSTHAPAVPCSPVGGATKTFFSGTISGGSHVEFSTTDTGISDKRVRLPPEDQTAAILRAQSPPEPTMPLEPRDSCIKDEDTSSQGPETLTVPRAPRPLPLSRAVSGESHVSSFSEISRGAKRRPSGTDGEMTGFWKRTELTALKLNKMQRITLSAPTLTKSNTKHFSVAGKWISPLHPDSWKRAVFDMASIMVLAYDSVIIPYQFAWEIPFEGWMAAVSWFTWTFWCVDFLLGFGTGYRKREKLVMEFRQIACRYLQTYFVPNLVVLAVELAVNVIETASQSTLSDDVRRYIKVSRFIKLNRAVRLTEVLRTGKVAQTTDFLVNVMRQWGMAKQFNFMTRVCKLVFAILWVNHLGGCLWSAVGTRALETYKANSFQDKSDYMLGYYWSASAMIAGESVMEPSNTGELVMTVMCVLFGFIFSSVLISSLLTTVMEYQESNKERSDKLKTLRQFLYQHNVDPAISVPIQEQVNDRMGSMKRLHEKDVGALSLLSPMMRSELWYSIYGPSIGEHSYIHACGVMAPGLIKDICYQALEHEAHEPGVRIFEPNTEAVGAHFVYWGSLDFLPVVQPRGFGHPGGSKVVEIGMLESDDTFGSTGAMLTPVDAGCWISVHALWVHWLHRGWLEASTSCEILTVKAEPFIELCIGSHPELIKLSQDYSSAVFEALKRESRAELSDIHTPVDHFCVLSAMPLESRIQLSWAAMTILQHKVQWSGKLFHPDGLKELENEVEAGDCDLVLEPDESIFRLVTIAALRLERDDGRILTQIGKCIKGQTVVSCTLPGTKLHVGELPGDAVRRLLNNKLRAFTDEVTLSSRIVDTQEKVSKKYGVPSRYMRTLFNAHILDPTTAADGIVVIPRLAGSERSLKGDSSPDGAASTATTGARTAPSLSSMRSGLGNALSNLSIAATPPDTDHAQLFEAFVFRHEMEAASTCFIYAWLPQQDYEALTGSGGDEPAHKWVMSLDMSTLEDSTRNNAALADAAKISTISMEGN